MKFTSKGHRSKLKITKRKVLLLLQPSCVAEVTNDSALFPMHVLISVDNTALSAYTKLSLAQ